MMPSSTYAEVSKDGLTVELNMDNGKRGLFVTRGAIAWPGQNQSESKDFSSGFACVVALEVATGLMFVMEEHEFIALDSFSLDGKQYSLKGLSWWLTQAWLKYKVHKFYTRENEAIDERYRRQIAESKNIQTKPMLIDAEWPGDEAALTMIESRIMEKHLFYAAEMPFKEALAKAKVSGIGLVGPIRAVAAALVGLERMEPRMRKKNNEGY